MLRYACRKQFCLHVSSTRDILVTQDMLKFTIAFQPIGTSRGVCAQLLEPMGLDREDGGFTYAA